jgi:hypothetical protein
MQGFIVLHTRSNFACFSWLYIRRPINHSMVFFDQPVMTLDKPAKGLSNIYRQGIARAPNMSYT